MTTMLSPAIRGLLWLKHNRERGMADRKACDHGVPLDATFCAGCRIVWCEEMLYHAEQGVRKYRAEIAELENGYRPATAFETV